MKFLRSMLLLASTVLLYATAMGEVAATNLYHNHMPNFWAYYNTANYATTPVGGPVRYAYDGQVINIKKAATKANYPYWIPTGLNLGNNSSKYWDTPMCHDPLETYYQKDGKYGAYLDWPMTFTEQMNSKWPLGQKHVTMSGAVVTNVQSFAELGNMPGYNAGWGTRWKNVSTSKKTTNGFPALDLVHFTGHHTMGPLTGSDYFLKELIYHNMVLSRDYFIGSSFKSSKGFFPTELGFSERLIPELAKIGVEWSVLGNVHYSRALKDYPYLNDPGKDCMISPPNRADMQNDDPYGGSWVERKMMNEQQVTFNKFPFSSIAHWVRYVDPETGAESKIAGIPVEQAGSWADGYQGGDSSAGFLVPFDANTKGRKQIYVLAHDGDNTDGYAGSYDCWGKADGVYSGAGIRGIGVDEYLKANPIPADDVQHVQDGSWIDTRDSSSDPTWYHWRIPFVIWAGQFTDFNKAMGTSYAPKTNLSGVLEKDTVSFEYGYHYLERNFALLQAAENYAKTAEQIWLADHPSYWKPTQALDFEQVGKNNTGNQLNPLMYSFPVKGDAANDYKGGANPAELAWYFMIAGIDSGFGYYDENVDDAAKPTLAFEQSLFFSKPYVAANIAKDKTGPSVWWPQRWPYNPGSCNLGKGDGWITHYFSNDFGVYTYAYDVSGIQDMKVKIRVHTNKVISPTDNTCRVYDPVALKAKGVANIDTASVGAWVDFPMKKRDLKPDINGVPWQPEANKLFNVVKATEIGDLYYAYMLDKYRDQTIDYYVEATDTKGNVTKSKIQQVYVGAGKYSKDAAGKMVEDVNGTIIGTYPFVTDRPPQPPKRAVTLYVENSASTIVMSYKNSDGTWSSNLAMTALASPNQKYKKNSFEFNAAVDETYVRYSVDNGVNWLPSSTGTKITSGVYTIYADNTVKTGSPAGITNTLTLYYKGTRTHIHWRPQLGTWSVAPGLLMPDSEVAGYKKVTLDLGLVLNAEVCFNTNNTNWDSNGGSNYIIPAGTYLFDESKTPKFAPYDPNPVVVVTDKLLGDFNSDASVGISDFIEFASNYGSATYTVKYDIAPATLGTGVWANIYSKCQPDSKVDINDFIIFANNYGKKPITVIPKLMTKKVLSKTTGSNKKFIISDVSAKANTSFKLSVKAENFKESTKAFEFVLKYNPEELTFNQDSIKTLGAFSKGLLIGKENTKGEVIVAVTLLKGQAKLAGDLFEIGFTSKKKSSIVTFGSAEISGMSDYSLTDKGYVIVK